MVHIPVLNEALSCLLFCCNLSHPLSQVVGIFVSIFALCSCHFLSLECKCSGRFDQSECALKSNCPVVVN